MANYYVTTTGASTKTGGGWATAFGLAEWLSHMATSAAAGDVYWIEEGTYTLTANFITTLSGGVGNNIGCVGVAAGTTNEPPESSDYADGGSRPLVACASYSISFNDWWLLRNIRLTLNTSSGLEVGSGAVVNCDLSNNASSGYVFTATDKVQLFDSKFNGNESGCAGLSLSDTSIISHCYITECVDNDIVLSGASLILINSILNSYETTSIELVAGNNYIVGNTFFSGDYPILVGNNNGNNIIMNNIFHRYYDGVEFSSAVNQYFVDHNNYYSTYTSGATDITNFTKGANALSVDPGFVDANEYEGADFSFSPLSPVVGLAFKMRLGVG